MTQPLAASPCGHLVPTVEGQQAFVPDPLPSELSLSAGLVSLLDRASLAVGTLAGVGETVPNPHLLIRPFLRREAVLSSRIEGTVASLSDVFAYEAAGRSQQGGDVAEVMNYVTTLEYGIDRLETLPISLRLVNELHQRLLSGVRGQRRQPGEFRQEQVWIGGLGSSIQDARFVPPPPTHLPDLFGDWERFVNESTDMPPLIRCALMHYQIETIHPYSDGNGRIGRLLIILFLYSRRLLPLPLLYLSAYFERDRQRYYDELYNVSATGDWERWIRYFLDGVYQEARDTLERIRRVRALSEQWRELLHSRRESANALRLLEEVLVHPIMTASQASGFLGISDAGARRVLDRLIQAGVVVRMTSAWPHLYVAESLLEEINAPITPSGQ